MLNAGEEALAHCHITSLLSLYYQALEIADFSTLEKQVMTQEAVWEVVQRSPSGTDRFVLDGRDAVIAWFKELMGDRGGTERPGAVRQYLDTHVITVQGDTAHSVSNLQAVRVDTLSILACGRAVADHVRTAAGWRISRYQLDERISDASVGAAALVAGDGP
jgi:hypothetical protein